MSPPSDVESITPPPDLVPFLMPPPASIDEFLAQAKLSGLAPFVDTPDPALEKGRAVDLFSDQ